MSDHRGRARPRARPARRARVRGLRGAVGGAGARGRAPLRERGPDLVLLDLMLPDANGYPVCEEIRTTHPLVPIIMLTARAQEADKIRGPRRGRRRLRHQAVLGRRAGRAHQRDLPPPAPHAPPASDDHDRRARSSTAQTRADPQGQDPRALVLRGRAAAPAVRARRPAGLARRDPREDLGHPGHASNRTVDNFVVKLRKKIEEDAAEPAPHPHGLRHRLQAGAVSGACRSAISS